MRASVILPTKDRGPAIEPTLDALLRLDFPDYEIVVVDNLSCDEDAERLRGWADREAGRARYVREPSLGLDNARNAGIRESRGEVIAFLDDDEAPAPHWLRSLVRAFDEHPDAWVAGGRVVLHFTTPAPEWLDERLRISLGTWDRGDSVRKMRYEDYPRGGNMAFRRVAFEHCGGFLDCLDRKGACLMSYGEFEMCYRIEQAGHEVLYVPDAEIVHVIDGDRLTRAWFAQRFYWQGRSEGLFECLHHGRSRVLRRLPYRLLGCLASRDRYVRAYHRGLVSGTLRNLLRARFE